MICGAILGNVGWVGGVPCVEGECGDTHVDEEIVDHALTQVQVSTWVEYFLKC